MTRMAPHSRAFGDHLRVWRQRRRMSQIDLALEAEISQKHLSFVESGRAAPSRAVVLSLAQHLDVPLRERNALLLAAGYAPNFPERPLDDPGLKPVRDVLGLILRGSAAGLSPAGKGGGGRAGQERRHGGVGGDQRPAPVHGDRRIGFVALAGRCEPIRLAAATGY